MKPISTIVDSIVTRNTRLHVMRNRIVGGPTDEASLDEVFFYETDGQPVTFRQFNYSLEQEIGR